MTVEQAIAQISALPIDDQLRIIQAIWDRLPDHVATGLSSAERAELDRRWRAYESSPDIAIPEAEFRAQARKDRTQ